MNNVDELKLAYQIAAKVVALFGNKYLPLFETLHIEIEKQAKLDQLKALATTISM
jgi:hypothetical protein